jgi:hypothetical protein
MMLVYRKGALSEADSLCRRPYFLPQATFPLFWMARLRKSRFTTEVPSAIRKRAIKLDDC